MNTKRVNAVFDAKLIENAKLIQSVPEELIAELEKDLIAQTAAGVSFQDMVDSVSKTFDISAGRAKTLVKTETSKISAAMTEARIRDLGCSQYIWHSAFLGTSRESHEALEGQQFDYDNPPQPDEWEEAGNAGELINCYCWPEPVLLKENEDPELSMEGDETDRTADGAIDRQTEAAINAEIDDVEEE